MTTTEQILTLAGALGVSGGEDGAVEAARANARAARRM